MKRVPLNTTHTSTNPRKIFFASRPARLAAIFILVALAATVVVSTAFSAKSPGGPERSGTPASTAKSGPSSATASSPLRAHAFASRLGASSAGSVAEESPTLTTDKESYEPGESITFTGTNWAPGEEVTIVVSDGESGEAEVTLQVTADENGSFTVTATLPEEEEAGPAASAKSTTSTNAKSGAPSTEMATAERDNEAADEADKAHTATATGGSSGASAQTQFKVDRQAEGEEDDADIPRFMVGKIDRGDYLRRRQEHINKLRGLEQGRSFDPGARGRAIREMNRQEGRPDSVANTADPGSKDTGVAAMTFAGALGIAAPISNSQWKSIGPAPLSNGQTFTVSQAVSGRVTSIAIHPTNPDIVYVAAAQGGVYRTLDGGNSWTPIFDNAQTLSVGSIAIAPSRPSTIYVGTGEGNFSCDSYFGVGVYRIDNADSPNPTLTGPINKDSNGNDVLSGWGIDKVLVHPTNPDIVFIGVTSGIGGVGCTSLNDTGSASTKPRGLFRSMNATQANPTFNRVAIAGMGNGGNRSVTDMEFEPGNPTTMLATVFGGTDGGVYRTINALDPAPGFTRTLAAGSSTATARVELAINKVGGQVTVFAATSESNGTVKRSIDGGVTWSAALTGATAFCGGQCTYDMPIAIDPTNANVIYLGGPGDTSGSVTGIFNKSSNALAATPTFTKMQTGLHADEHAIEIDPTNSNIVWTGNDGGIWKSANAAATWTSLNNTGFNATQFVSIALHPLDAYYTIGGTQDNGTERMRPDGTWTRTDFGDGGFALIDQSATDTTTVRQYHTYFNQIGNLVAYATSTSSTAFENWTVVSLPTTDTATEFYAPMALGPGTPNTVYFATDRLRRSANTGTTNTVVSQAPIVSGVPISAVGISPQNDNVRIVGLENGQVWRTMTGSSTLNNVTGTIPARYVSRAVIDPTNQNTAYVTLSGYFGNSTPHIYKTTDLNSATPTWTGIGNTIPDVPVNAFAVDPGSPNTLYAGTDIGVFRSTDGGATFAPFSNGLPRVAVFDMAIQNANRILRIATHGRGMWEISLDPAETAGTLQGTVRDAVTNNPIGGINVTAGSYSTTTNGAGFYQFTSLSPDTYTVTASGGGYASASASVTVNYAATTTQDFSLSFGSVSGCWTDTTQADFQAGLGTNVDTTTTPDSVQLAVAAPLLDQQQTATSTSGNGITTTTWEAQTFVPAVTGSLTQLDVSLFCSGCSGTNPPVTVDIRTTSGGLPTGTILATTTIPGFSSGSSSFYSATFSTPATLTAGTTYAFVLRLATNRTGTYASLRTTTNAYANGAWIQSTTSGASWATQTTDLVFKTYMSNGFNTSGNLVSSVKDANAQAGGLATWGTLVWTAATPANTSVKFQVAGSNVAEGPYNFVGPDNTSGSFFTNGASLSQFNGKRFLKYRASLGTTVNTATPVLNDVTICFSDLLPTSLVVAPATGTYGGTTNLSATLTSSNGSLVSGKTVNFTLNGNSVGSAMTNGSGVAALSNASLSGINVGSYPSGVGASFAGDSAYVPASGTNSLTVNKDTPTITWNNPADITYGAALGGTELNATASVPGSFIYTPAAGTVLVAGNGQNLHVDFTPTDTANYTGTSKDVSINVLKAPLSVTADGKSREYGEGNPPFTASYSGFVNGDNPGSLSGTLGFVNSATAASPVGLYSITPGGLTSTNYAITFVDGTLEVTKAPLTIKAADAMRDYGAVNPSFSGTITGIKNSDNITATYSTPATQSDPVGNYPIIPAAVDPDGKLPNYDLTLVNGTLAVGKVLLTITADDKTKVYGAALPPLTFTPTGFVNGDTAATAFTGSPALTTTATAASPVGPYSITAAIGSLASSNYSFTFVGGTLQVTKAPLTITADDKTKVYGAALPPFTFTPSGFVNGDTAMTAFSGSPALATVATAASNVGPYPITAAVGTLASSNYSFNFVSGTLQVTKAPLTIKADDKAKQYSDPLPAFTATYTGFVLGQGPSALSGALSFATPATATSPANANGTPLGYTITPSGQTSSNYAITYLGGTLTVSTENAALTYTGDSLVSPNKAGGSVNVKLAALATEEADGSLGNTLAGKTVRFSIYKSNNTSMLTADYTVTAVIGAGNTASTILSLTEDNYTVKLELLPNSQYAAPVETAIFTVVDPGTGIVGGGGWLNDPSGGRGNFGFTVKYVKSGNAQGNSLYIYRTQADFSQYGAPAGLREYNVIFKSNAMGAMQSSPNANPKTAQFTGKANVKAVDRLTGATYDIGGGINYNFQVDVTDKGEPSGTTTPDTYAFRVWTTTGNFRPPVGTYDSAGKNTAQVPLQGGNVQVK